jgi:hypothetical protein
LGITNGHSIEIEVDAGNIFEICPFEGIHPEQMHLVVAIPSPLSTSTFSFRM